ncbi:MAG TPA: SDR family NAD(P)-dependent oxidoreductase [Christensenellaceae bacterium]|jgi:NADP-dependent 3-hydroxy acid dehydrogenase YdfG|nr:SDR family NAD(P)-dependent oxidoreductase [Christensenellaceae bacterium]
MKTVFFTGATGGLGELCVRALSKRGWQVFAVGTNNEKLRELGKLPNVIPIHANVCDIDSLKAAKEKLLKYTNCLDAVVNFAGISVFSSLVEREAIQLMEKLIDINVLGTARVNAIMIDLIEKGKGRIINCSSTVGWAASQPFAGAYCASKRAIEAYNDSLRRELMFIGIPVIKIQPGAYKTKLLSSMDDQYLKALKITTRYQTVLKRLKFLMKKALGNAGNPQELVDTVIRALEDKRPRLKYRKGTGFLMYLMSVLPSNLVDWCYRTVLKLPFGKSEQ